MPDARLERVIASSRRWRGIEHHEEIGSTNARGLELARRAEGDGLVIVADHQTRGRGRRERAWEDAPGRSLLVSAVTTSGDRAPTLVPLAAGLAVVDAIRAGGTEAALKWPNDVLVDERKCAGILVEVADGGLVIGIGVNVDWREVERPDASWGSLAEASGRDEDRWELLAALLPALERRLDGVEAAPEAVLVDYRAACATIGRKVQVEVADGLVVGEATGVDADGALLVTAGERELRLRAGDVVHLRTAR